MYQRKTLARFVGIPYKKYEYEYTGCDCWGLVVLFYRDILGISLPQTKNKQEFFQKTREAYKLGKEVDSPQFGDVVMFKHNHVGVMIDDKRFLHAANGFGSGIERVDSYKWKNQVEKYIRYNTKNPQ